MMYYLRFFLICIIFINCQTDNSIDLDDRGGIKNDDGVGLTKEIKITKITNLTSEINETSGLINFNGRLITHNDSGGKPNLYEIDVTTGNIMRTVIISNAANRDMEDIAQDDIYIYLCDIGNNSNQRKDQTIYKIRKSDYLEKEQIEAEKITLSYKEQTDFSRTSQSTNFDAEAVVSVGDNLFLFTKNWGDLRTSVYKIPKEKGNYILSKIDSYNIKGLITGADFNKNTNTIILTGYSNFSPFIVKLTDFSQNNPLDGKIDKKQITITGSPQIEGVSVNPDNSYYISAEASLGFPAVLYKLIY